MKYKIQVIELAEILQYECHELVDEMVKHNSKLSYQDVANTFIFLKLVEIIQEINNLKEIHTVYK
jgi:hypothetical protein